ncbi:MAG TPA: GAF domain-containing protein [Anaeromyxobacter sp.]
MLRFEVFCPATPPALPADVTLRVEAEHWLAALKAGLRKVGGPQLTTNVLCDVQADGSIHVSDPQGGGVFRIQELRAEPAAVPAAAGQGGPSSRAASVEEVAPSAIPPGPIGRAARAASAEDVLAELFERVADLARQPDRSAGLGFLLDLAMEKVDAEAGSVFLARLEGRELELAVARGPRAKELLALGVAVPVGVGIVGFCAQEDVCLAVSDAERDARFHRAVSEAIGYETRSLLCAPIARKGQVLGAIEVLNKRGGRPFGSADLSVLSYLAHQAAVFIARGSAS